MVFLPSRAAEAAACPVTSADNGKVLAVENGAWAARETDYVVTFTKSGSTWSADKNVLEISDAISAKKRVYASVSGSLITSTSPFASQTILLPLSGKSAAGSNGYTFCGSIQTGTTTIFADIVISVNAQLITTVTSYIKEVEIAPAPLVVTYTITGTPIADVYPLSTVTSYASIVAALTAGREVVAALTSGTQELRMRLVSMNSDPSTGYVAFSAVTEHIASPGTLALYQIVHNVDESVQGLIVPLITGTMTYNSSTNTLDISGV